MYFTSAKDTQPSTCPSGSHTSPSRVVMKAAMKLQPAAGTASSPASGATITKMLKYHAISGAVNTMVPSVAARLAAKKRIIRSTSRRCP